LKLKDIYQLFVNEGIKTDLRNKKQLGAYLLQRRKAYQVSRYKKFFDREDLTNPFSDTRILYGAPQKEIKRILVGIDMEVGEILLADRLREMGCEIDLVLAHHPEGIALAALDEVMHLQTDVLENLGLRPEIAKDLMEKRIKEVSRKLHGHNHTRIVDAAKLMGIPFMCCHTPSDNHVAQYLQKLMDRKKPKTLKAIVDLLMQEPEYQDAVINKAGPQILIGKPETKAGRIIVDMTGGTEGSKDVFARLSQLGVNTLLGMHLSEQHYLKIKSEHMHVIIAGHIASDNLGMNLLLDKLERKSDIEVIECSGFRRVKR
jgi:putative NIF3 family GTP cyclohydrolase 1 type 2